MALGYKEVGFVEISGGNSNDSFRGDLCSKEVAGPLEWVCGNIYG